MNDYPEKARKRVRQPVAHESDIEVEPVRGGSFLSFSYSYKEVSLSGGKTRVRSSLTRFEDGKLSSEEFEGTLDSAAYERAISEAQRRFLGQTAAWLEQFSAFLPFFRK